MNRRNFTFSALLGLFGTKLAAQQQNTGIAMLPQDKWSDPRPDGNGGCFSDNTAILSSKRVVCKEGEEYCPLGHSQKPQAMQSQPQDLDGFIRARELLMEYVGPWINFGACSKCGIVYQRNKP